MSTINLFQRSTDVVRFQAGEVMFEAGEPADMMYVLVAGEAKVERAGQQIAALGPGEILGELAFLDGGPRTASAVAMTECVLAPIDRKRFEFMVVHTPRFAEQVLRILAERLRQTLDT
jgi:CRP-like cAMP-binding protein